jgi:stearoyl-CoA desaturase (delta-9 desaturase)
MSAIRPQPRRSLANLPFLLFHVAALGAFFFGLHWRLIVLALASYYLRMFFVTAGYHRYFSHRGFKTGRVFQFVLAFMAQTSAQKGALWWASHHRAHHAYSDTERDVHSPVRRGFWWAHVGWILSPDYEATDDKRIKDYARYPELVFLNRHSMLPPTLYALAMLAIGGWSWLFWGFFLSTVLLFHGTFVINSLAHVVGRRRFPTRDESRNSLALALVTMGEGWHNNHHWFPIAARQGFYFWEIDLTYYALKALSWVGVVSELRGPPPQILEEGRASGRRDRPIVAPMPG